MAERPSTWPRRNIGIIAHIDAGKTTVTERMLLYAGRIRTTGEVHDGEATMDWREDERERGITISTAATSCEWNRHVITILDTPGHVDFTAEVERSLRVLDGAVGVFDGKHGVEAQSETVWRQADRYDVPRIAFVNKMDATGADFERALTSIRERLACPAVSVVIPWGTEASFAGVIDLIRGHALRFEGEAGERVEVLPIPEELRSACNAARGRLIETVTDAVPEALGESVVEAFLAGEDIPPDDLDGLVREATLSGAIVPVLCGSALRNIGIQPLLDAAVRWLPAPEDLPPFRARIPDDPDRLLLRARSVEEPFAALAFKISHDRHGDLTYVRVYSGFVDRGAQLLNSRVGKPERVGRVFAIHANRRQELQRAIAGQIVGIAGLRWTATGDTLCDKAAPILLEPPTFPQTVVARTIEPKSSAQREKLTEILRHLGREDPTFVVEIDEDTGATLMKGMGELHLEVKADRIRREFHVDVRIGEPRVGYRETAGQRAVAEAVVKRELGGRHHYAQIRAEVVPDPTCDEGPQVDLVAGDDIPREFHVAVHDGALAGASTGPAGGYPVICVRVRILSGSTRPGEASEIGFAQAANEAVRNALEVSAPTLLEPEMRFTMTLPPENLGAALDELNSRRAEIGSMDHEGELCVVTGRIPLVESFGFPNELRSLSQGRGRIGLEPHSFAPVPAEVARRVLGLP